MFNLDDVDVDFNDEIFDDFKSKSSLNLNKSSDRGTLSYGIGTSSDEICLPKKLCLGNSKLQSQISILSKANDTQNIKDYQEKHSNTQNFQSFLQKNLSQERDIDSPSYSPITSTQKEIDIIKRGYLFDSTNKISPIKIKPGICSELKKPSSIFSTDKKISHVSVNSQKFPGPAGNLPKNNLPNGLPNSKIPIICLVISEIEYMPMDAAAILSDETGSIKCAIHRQVLETYNEKLKTGSVLILKKVSIFSPSGKKYYFNITKSNIADIISSVDEDWEKHPLICEKDIENIINECSKIPEIIFDPESLFKDTRTNAAVNQSINLEIAPPTIPDNKQIEFFDDGANFLSIDFVLID